MTDLLPSSRFRLLDKPTINPGKCAVCGGVETPVIDFGATVQFYGAVMICTTCLAEAARGIGMVPVSEVVDSQKAADQVVNEYLANHNLKVITNEQFGSISSLYAGLHDIAISASSTLPVEDSSKPASDDSTDFEQLVLFNFDDEGTVTADDKSAGGEGTDGVSDTSIDDLR